MTSFVSNLKRGLSMNRDTQHNCPRSQSSIPNSPSFSDFSLGAEMEAEHELWKGNKRKTLDHSNSSSPIETSTNGKSTWATMFGSPSARDIPQPNTPQSASPTVMAQSVPRRRPEGKIGGMSYYDYHDLIRSSSL